MHEMGLAKDVLRKLLHDASAKKISKIKEAKVNIGETLITDKEEFFELFKDISKGTPAEGMKLNVRISPLMAFCNKCSKDFSTKAMTNGCPTCSGSDFKIVSGKEIIVEEVK
jgi:hydrogenase nickel incorporation protein HypA/HybF